MPRLRTTRPLQDVHTRLFKEDVKALKKRAEARGIHWQTELRSLVHRVLQSQSVRDGGEPTLLKVQR